MGRGLVVLRPYLLILSLTLSLTASGSGILGAKAAALVGATLAWPNSLHSTQTAVSLIFSASLDCFVRRVAWSKGVDWADQVARPAVDVSRPIANAITMRTRVSLAN